MYLKRIESYGFKSFANKTNIEFEQGMNVIVGPNGSGKSNIIDATRWVLGEQSAKALRGGNMQDVIFKGSSEKQKLGYAEVTLILDNSDRQLPIDFTELSVTRRLYRSGESLYLINNEKVRLQDVTNLFMDSGIGKESFSIIGQGRIDEILNSKAVDRRSIFEEAAGVLKYKTRKEQSLRRLERTHENLTRVNDIISELELQVEPLKKQAETASLYLEHKDELEKFEVNLLVYEINTLSEELAGIERNMTKLTLELTEQNVIIETSTQALEAQEAQIVALDEEVTKLQAKLVQVTQEAETARGTTQLHEQKKEHLESTIADLEADQALFNEKLTKIETLAETSAQVSFTEKLQDIDAKIATQKEQLQAAIAVLEGKQQDKLQVLGEQKSVSARYATLKEIADSNRNLFQGVREVIKAKKTAALSGIEGTIIELIDVDDKYAKAIETALGSALQHVITDSGKAAELAIAYLKKHQLGRATFYPLDVIVANKKDNGETFNNPAVFGFAHTLLKYDAKYTAVMSQLLGKTIIVSDLQAANKFAKETNFRYRLVTLEGDIVHRGGSMTGGNHNHNEKSGLLSQKKELKHLQETIGHFDAKLREKDHALALGMDENKKLQRAIELSREERFKIEQQEQLFEQQLAQLSLQKEELETQLVTLADKLSGQQKQLRDLDALTNELSDSYLASDQLKDQIIADINAVRAERLGAEREKQETLRKQRSAEGLYRELERKLQKDELAKNTAEIKGNDRITRLQEHYNCSYESVKDRELHDDYDVVEERVRGLRHSIDKMGVVNLGAIEEYERVYERFHYLTDQREDLLQAENNLLSVINDMDGEMTDRFVETFGVIQTNFAYTFKKLFGGGDAKLQLTDKKDVLVSGIEIFAQPPGKKIQNLSLLSGGERALTAIALLFAILKTKAVPFCILDEVEAALDEANVERFAKYLKSFSKESQFIVVSHRKGTMEEADILYGVTMEEAGVSRILSVKLQDADKYLD